MKVQNEFKLYNERIGCFTLKSTKNNEQELNNEMVFGNNSRNKNDNYEINKIETLKNIEIEKKGKIGKNNNNSEKQYIFSCNLNLKSINNKNIKEEKDFKLKGNNQIKNTIITHYKKFNLSELSKIIFDFFFFIEIIIYFKAKEKFHNATINNKLYLLLFERKININNFFWLFILISFTFNIYYLNLINAILNLFTTTLFNFEERIYSKLLLLNISLYGKNILIFIFIFYISIVLLKSNLMKMKKIELKKTCLKSYKKNIGLFEINYPSKIIYQIKEYKELTKINFQLKEKVEKNKKKKALKNFISDNNYIVKFIIKLLIINIFSIIKSFKLNINYFRFSKITLKINGVGDINILGNNGYFKFDGITYLEEVYINGIKNDTIGRTYYLNETENLIELIWNDEINSCIYMFYGCSKITEINLCNFNTSLVRSMKFLILPL